MKESTLSTTFRPDASASRGSHYSRQGDFITFSLKGKSGWLAAPGIHLCREDNLVFSCWLPTTTDCDLGSFASSLSFGS